MKSITKPIFGIFLYLLVNIVQAQEPIGFNTTKNGLQYKIIFDSAGIPAEFGGLSFVNMVYFNKKDNFNSTKINGGKPIPIRLPDSLKYRASLEEGLSLLSAGDSAIIIINTDSLYKNVFKLSVPKEIKGSMTTFYLKIINNLSKDSVQLIEKKQEENKNARVLQQSIQFKIDTALIANYCRNNNLKVKLSPEGVSYIVNKKQKGETLQSGDSIKVYYTGKFLDGTIFDSNLDGIVFPVVTGTSPIIPGWHSALKELKKGEKATIIIPSLLAYGDRGASGDKIPPNTILLFDIEILK